METKALHGVGMFRVEPTICLVTRMEANIVEITV